MKKIYLIVTILSLLSTSFACTYVDPIAVISDIYSDECFWPTEPFFGCLNENIYFEGCDSEDPYPDEGTITDYQWTYPIHSNVEYVSGQGTDELVLKFKATGIYTISLVVVDDDTPAGTSDPVSIDFNIIDITAFTPNRGTEIDDGDLDNDTKEYTASIASSDYITVSSTIVPIDPGYRTCPQECYTYTGGVGTPPNYTRYIDATTAGTTTVTGTITTTKQTKVHVVEVSSLTPDEGTEQDDGDGDSNTKAYLIGSTSSDDVIVTAVSNPGTAAGIDASELPSDWALTGGTVLDGLTSYVNKSAIGFTEVVATCGSSQKKCKIIVEPDSGVNDDRDGDGLSNLNEHLKGSDHQEIDSDGDGLVDGLDGNITVAAYYALYGTYGVDKDSDGYIDGEGDTGIGTDPASYDSDGDGLSDGWEYTYSSIFDPLDSDSDNDGTLDGADNDDTDSLTNLQEQQYGTDPTDEDTDNDGMDDDDEVANDLDPTVSSVGESWVEYAYDASSNATAEMTYAFVNSQVVQISESHYKYDKLGRKYESRKLATPGGSESDSNDDITLNWYDRSDMVTKTIRKGPGESSLTAVEADDIVVAYLYDSYNRTTKITDTMGNDTTFEYDENSRVTRLTLPGSRIATREYDVVWRATKVTDPSGNYTVTDYDSHGNAITAIGYNSSDTKVSQQRGYYDSVGALTRQVIMATPASTGSASTSTDRVTDYVSTYDSTNTRYVITYSGTNVITSKSLSSGDISGRGQPTENTKGLTTSSSQPKTTDQYFYDKAGRTTKKIAISYDESASAGLSITTKMLYDQFGRTTASIASGDSDLTTGYKYDGAGRRSEATDPEGNRATYAYDVMGRLTLKTEDADGIIRETEYIYDRLGRQVTLIANDGTADQTTAYDYDEAGQVTRITYPDNGQIKYVYDTTGKVSQRMDQNANTTVYGYDSSGRLLTKENAVTSPSIVEVYAYDARGLMTMAIKGDGTDADAYSRSEMDYNGLGVMTESRQTVLDSTNNYTTGYEYNQLGKATTIYYPDTTGSPDTISYTYSSLGQIDNVSRDSVTHANYDYYGRSVKIRQYYDDTAAHITFKPHYDSFGRVTLHQNRDENGTDIASFTYSYDDNSNIISKIFEHRDETPPSNVYSYDTLNRVTRADYHNSENERFTYDKLGNRITLNNRADTDVVYTHNTSNEYTAIAGVSPLYDAAGNLTKDVNGYTYHYDHENRITNIKKTNDTVDVANYTYDALGRRIQVEDAIANTKIRCYYDGQRVLLDTNYTDGNPPTETIRANFVYGNYIDEVIYKFAIINPSRMFYVHDHLYSPVALTNYFGSAVHERYEYDAYGKVAIMDASYSPRDTALYKNPYTFTGRRLDALDINSGVPGLEIMYYRARYYDTETGRFMQKDPLGINPAGGEANPFAVLGQYSDGMNIYQYVLSNAVNYIDPLGLERKYDNCVARCEEVLGDTGGMGGKCWTKCSIRSEAEACSVASNHGMRLCLIGCNLSSDANDPRPAREFRKAMDKALKRCSCSSSGIPLIVLVLFLMLIVIKEKRTV